MTPPKTYIIVPEGSLVTCPTLEEAITRAKVFAKDGRAVVIYSIEERQVVRSPPPLTPLLRKA
jgi:hypothetical protein